MLKKGQDSVTAPDTLITQDRFLDGRLSLRQMKHGPRTAIDAFFLAAAVPAIEGQAERVLDAGTGNGSAGLALCSRVNDVSVTGVEIQPELLELSKANACENGLQDRFKALRLDITGPEGALAKSLLGDEKLDHVMANPPFHDARTTRASDNPVTARAYTAHPGELEKWMEFLKEMTAPGGTLTMIHRADMLDDLLKLFGNTFGSVSVFPLFPKEGAPSKRVIIQGIKGSKAPINLLPGMVLHKTDGAYTNEANAVLRQVAPIDMSITSR